MRQPVTLGRVARSVAVLAVLCVIATASGSFSCGGGSSSSPPPSPTGTSSLAGTVTDAVTAGPVSGATVAVQNKSVTTGADGRYSITGLVDGASTVTAQHQGHRNLTQTSTITGATTRDLRLLAAPETRGSGPWTGAWTNQTSGTSGNINLMLTVNTVAQTMTIALKVDGPAYGRSGPLTDTITGAYSPTTGANFTTTSSIFGNITFLWPPTGVISGSAVNVPGGTVSRVDFIGEASSPDIDVIVTMKGEITFANGSKGTNSFTLTCVRSSSTSSCG